MRHTLMILALMITGCSDKTVDSADASLDGVDLAVETYLPPNYVATSPKRVLFMGDSITAGGGVTSSSKAYASLLQENNDSEWPNHVGVDLKTTFPSINEIVDVSEYGATSASMVNSQLDAAESQLGGFPVSGETIIVVTIGGNDAQSALFPGADVDAIMQTGLNNIDKMIAWVNEPGHFPDGVFVYATNVYEPTNGDGQAADCFFGLDLSTPLKNLPPFNDSLIDMGKENGMAVVDLHGHFDAHGHNAENASLDNHDADDPTIWFANDCIHPNERGHHEIRRLFHAAITGQPLMLE